MSMHGYIIMAHNGFNLDFRPGTFYIMCTEEKTTEKGVYYVKGFGLPNIIPCTCVYVTGCS